MVECAVEVLMTKLAERPSGPTTAPAAGADVRFNEAHGFEAGWARTSWSRLSVVPFVIFHAMPLLIILILLAHPSLIPYRSTVRLSFKPPFIFLNNAGDD